MLTAGFPAFTSPALLASDALHGLQGTNRTERNFGGRAVNYRELAERLTALGLPENERNISNKISRGGFTAAFFFQCMHALGTRRI